MSEEMRAKKEALFDQLESERFKAADGDSGDAEGGSGAAVGGAGAPSKLDTLDAAISAASKPGHLYVSGGGSDTVFDRLNLDAVLRIAVLATSLGTDTAFGRISPTSARVAHDAVSTLLLHPRRMMNHLDSHALRENRRNIASSSSSLAVASQKQRPGWVADERVYTLHLAREALLRRCEDDRTSSSKISAICVICAQEIDAATFLGETSTRVTRSEGEDDGRPVRRCEDCGVCAHGPCARDQKQRDGGNKWSWPSRCGVCAASVYLCETIEARGHSTTSQLTRAIGAMKSGLASPLAAVGGQRRGESAIVSTALRNNLELLRCLLRVFTPEELRSRALNTARRATVAANFRSDQFTTEVLYTLVTALGVVDPDGSQEGVLRDPHKLIVGQEELSDGRPLAGTVARLIDDVADGREQFAIPITGAPAGVNSPQLRHAWAQKRLARSNAMDLGSPRHMPIPIARSVYAHNVRPAVRSEMKLHIGCPCHGSDNGGFATASRRGARQKGAWNKIECTWSCACASLGAVAPRSWERKGRRPIWEAPRCVACRSGHRSSQEGLRFQCEVRESKGRGLGLFAATRIAKDQVLGTYVGEVIDAEECQRREKHYEAQADHHRVGMYIMSTGHPDRPKYFIDAMRFGNGK